MRSFFFGSVFPALDLPTGARGAGFRHHSLMLPVAAVAMALCSESVRAQAPIYPSSRHDEPNVVELQVVDRFQVPVQNAIVDVTTTRYGVMAPYLEGYPFGTTHSHGLITDSQGMVRFSAPHIAPSLALVFKGGYASALAYWMWPGWKYRLVLHLGSVASFVCSDASGKQLAGVPIRLWSQDCSGMPVLAHPQATIYSDAEGRAEAYFLRNSQYVAVAGNDVSGMGIARFQVSNQYGHEETVTLKDIPILIEPARSVSIIVVDELQEPLPKLTVNYFSPFGQFSGWAEYRVEGNTVAFDSLPQLAPHVHHVKIGAAGYRPVMWSSDASFGDSPRIITTIRLEKDDTTTLQFTLPDHLKSARVLIPAMFTMLSPWIEVEPASDGRFEICALPKSMEVFGVLETAGHVLAFLARGDSASDVRIVEVSDVLIQYEVAGFQPELICNASWIGHPQNMARNLWILWERYVASDPSGIVYLNDVFPGSYSLDPHMHGTVYRDSFRTVSVAEGSKRSETIVISRGGMLAGRVVTEDSSTPVTVGYVVCRASNDELHFPVAQLTHDGRFSFSGLPEDNTYSLTYHCYPWYCVFHRPKPWNSVEFHSISVDGITLPRQSEVEIKIPENLSHWPKGS